VLVLMFGSWSLNEIWIIDLYSPLVSMLMSSSKVFLFFRTNGAHLISSVRLLLELYYVIVIKHVAFFTICAKLTIAFTFTSLPLNFHTSVSGWGCGFGFEQKYWRIDGFGEKKGTDRRICIPLFTPFINVRRELLMNIFVPILQSCIYSLHCTLTRCLELCLNQWLEDVPCMVIHVPKYLIMIVVEYFITKMGCCM